MKKSVFACILLLTLIIPAVNAEISFSQPNSVYNLGDDFSINLDVSSNSDTNSFLVASLICSNSNNITNENKIELYRAPISVKAFEKKAVDISMKFDSSLISNLEGSCYIEASYNKETSRSQTFLITRNVDVSLLIEGKQFNPGEFITINGQAVKENGANLNGFVDISIDVLGVNIVEQVNNGKFNTSVVLPEKSSPGVAVVSGKAYEKDSNGDITNFGTFSETFRVKQIAKSIDIALGSSTIIPGEDFIYNVLVYDQIGQEIERDVVVKITKTDNSLYKENIVPSSKSQNLSLSTSEQYGTWTILATSSNLSIERNIFVEELELLNFSLENKTLVVKNIGNIPFIKAIEIAIGNVREVKNLNLKVGEEKRFRLSAPEGEYGISVLKDGTSHNIGTALLTGRAVSIDDFGKFRFGSISVFVWIALILILLAIAVYLYIRIRKKSYFAGIPSKSEIKVKTLQPSSSLSKETSIIDSGQKQQCAIISLKIKNLIELERNKMKDYLSVIDSALVKAKEAKAKIYVSENYRIMIFSQLLTQEADNSLRAVNTARAIKEVLEEYNRKHPNTKINFGIGVHVGDLIVEKRNNEFRFSSLGNTVTSAKKLSENSSYDILLSEELHAKTVGKVRSEKLSSKAWKLADLRSKYRYDEFIERFEEKRSQKKD